MDELLSKLSELESQVSGMDKVINKIEGLEKEIERRNPTPVERLEMRSLSSFPYSVKLTDFWNEESEEDPTKMGDDYVLTQDDVKKDFNASTIKTSFDIQNPEDQEFEG